MKKVRLKRTVKAKFILFIIVTVIMAALIIGKLWVHSKTAGGTELTTEAPTEINSQETEPETTVETTAEETTEAVTEPAATEPATVKKADLSNPVTIDTNAGKWELLLVNMTHILPDNYVPSLGNAVSGSTVKMDSRATAKYQAMYDAAKKDGCILTPYSGYVSIARQNENYRRKVNYFVSQGLTEDEAKIKTSETILPGGCSEHNLGLSMDIVSASTDFATTKEFTWLTKNAVNYGFILRYPESKTDKTGVNYQPWHWRYVGVEAAKAMEKSGQCLEEYLGA